MTATSIPALLEPIQHRLNAATPGPWAWDHSNPRRVLEGRGGEQVLACAALLYPEKMNQEFIAAAPTDQARLLAAVQAVTTLHRGERTEYREDATCTECGHYWPCPTVAAVVAALGGEA